jgi:hypothetical protein
MIEIEDLNRDGMFKVLGDGWADEMPVHMLTKMRALSMHIECKGDPVLYLHRTIESNKWIVLRYQENNCQPYVVHTYFDGSCRVPEGFVWGHYFQHQKDAEKKFNEMVASNLSVLNVG